MGLDMYLRRKHCLYGEELEDIVIKGKLKDKIKKDNIVNITEEILYWRKANHIHQWFVNNVQDGNDNCKEYYVSEKQLEKLLEICKKVRDASRLVPGKIHTETRFINGKREQLFENGKIIEDPSIAQKLLPVTEGFFFGSKEYNQYYIASIQETIESLEELLKQGELYADIYYSSSW